MNHKGHFMLTHAITADPAVEFAAEVRAGLTRGQKELPSKYLYDDVGSALFEVISVLPQYGLTRADERLLRRHAQQIVEQVPGPVAVAELGSGSGKKTRWLLKALCRMQHVSYFPIEISPTALAMCERELGDIDCMSIVGFEREYLDGLLEVAARRRERQNLLVLFLGSTIGNFDRPAAAKFLREVRRILQPGDSLLLGTDLEKPIPQLLAAYDDPLGVTAAFNLNLLARINRELDANFVLDQFEHVARFNPGSTQRGDAAAFPARTDRDDSPGVDDSTISRRGNHLDREQPQVFRQRNVPDRLGYRLLLQGPVD